MANVFNEAKLQILQTATRLDMEVDTLRMMLFTTSEVLTSALKNLSTVAAVLGDAAFTEAADGTYTGQFNSGRQDVAVGSVTKDDTADQAEFDAPDLTWIGLDNDILTGAMIFKFDTNDAGSTPIGYYDFANLPTNGGDVTIEFSATDGFFTLGG